MTEFLNNAITVIFFIWLIILGKRIDLLEASNFVLKKTAIMTAEEIDKLRIKIARLERKDDEHEID